MEIKIERGWSFPPHFDKTDAEVLMTSEMAEIQGSLAVIFSTKLGERLFRPEFGCSIEDYQFKSMDSANVIRMRKMIEQAVRRYEPRIEVHDLDFGESDLSEGQLKIVLKYSLKESYSSDGMEYIYKFENSL